MKALQRSFVATLICALVGVAYAQQDSTVSPKLSPPEARKDREPRTTIRSVVLRVIVDRDGNVESVSVTRSLAKKLDKEAMRAVKKWRFDTAKKDGQPVRVMLLVEVNFRCEEPTGECQVVEQAKTGENH